MADQIIIDGIQVMAYVGVPDEERAQPQLLEIDTIIDHDLSHAARTERLGMSIDYAEVHRKILEIVHIRPRPLIETVAEDIAQNLILHFRIQRVEVTVRKFILPHTRSVAVHIVRQAR